MILGGMDFNLLAIVLVMILRVTLQRAMGMKSLGLLGELFLGIRQILVWLKQVGSPPPPMVHDIKA